MVKKLKRKDYDARMEPLQLELNNLARWLRLTGRRMVVLLEGRDAAGKGGVISAITERLNPRQAHVVALGTPSDRERAQWYFQRYIAHLPAAGELVLFDRSWYNRAGVETVMGFCTPKEHKRFLEQAPVFEQMLVDDGVILLKYWLSVDQAQQEERFAERAADPLKRWKLSPIDLKARQLYAEYGTARDVMFKATHSKTAPWFVVDFADQRRGRVTLIRHLLDQVPDTKTLSEPIDLPPLKGKPAREKFTGPVKPLAYRRRRSDHSQQ
ncbi:MAG: polyphosphate kinase 2 [Acidobacteria bacterium]|nr:polyphosphate kinase 2 [Acidobacteriota bacterium]